MKKLMMLLIISHLLFRSHLNCSYSNAMDGWVKVETKDNCLLYTKQLNLPDGRLKKEYAILVEGVMCRLAPVTHLDDDSDDSKFEQRSAGLSNLSFDENISLERAQNMQLTQPKFSRTYLAKREQQEKEEREKQDFLS